ncbi:MAG: GIY-YIG nuclease family protein [Candidatus Andersenbacteria bacterium]
MGEWWYRLGSSPFIPILKSKDSYSASPKTPASRHCSKEALDPNTYISFVYYVYILRSTKDKKLYIGYTRDLKKRLWEHNHKRNFSTKGRTPFELLYYEAYKAQSDALKREHNLKLHGNALGQLKRRISQSL